MTTRSLVRFPLAGLVALGGLVPALARAQATVPPAAAPPPGPAVMQPGATYVPGPSANSTFGPNTTSPSGTIGGGNATESSAHPVVGAEEDTFDLGHRGAGSGATVHGDDSGPIFIGGRAPGGEVPYSHIVRSGDTLWGICGTYYQNPYQWPRVWSYNPQVKNPHWIYPGDELHLRDPAGDKAAAGRGSLPVPFRQQTLVDRRRQVPSGTIFLRDQGWILDPADDIWGDITGAAEDKIFLTDLDEVYLHIDKGHDVRLGDELSVFKPLHSAAAGTIVQINGTARIDRWDPQDRVARAQIVESLGVIERGARVGPLSRRFQIVPPRRNDVELQAHVLASIHPEQFWGQNQVVFIDKGESAGLKPGNRLFIMRRGDAWRRSLVTPSAGYRVSPDDEKPLPTMEQTPTSHQDEVHYPDEVIAELRVVTLKKDSAACLVTEARSEIESLDLAVAHKGY